MLRVVVRRESEVLELARLLDRVLTALLLVTLAELLTCLLGLVFRLLDALGEGGDRLLDFLVLDLWRGLIRLPDAQRLEDLLDDLFLVGLLDLLDAQLLTQGVQAVLVEIVDRLEDLVRGQLFHVVIPLQNGERPLVRCLVDERNLVDVDIGQSSRHKRKSAPSPVSGRRAREAPPDVDSAVYPTLRPASFVVKCSFSANTR